MCTAILFLFFFNHTATTEIYTLSLHDALPIWEQRRELGSILHGYNKTYTQFPHRHPNCVRSEEHTSELQSHVNLVCRLLLEKKNTQAIRSISDSTVHHFVEKQRVLTGQCDEVP